MLNPCLDFLIFAADGEGDVGDLGGGAGVEDVDDALLLDVVLGGDGDHGRDLVGLGGLPEQHEGFDEPHERIA